MFCKKCAKSALIFPGVRKSDDNFFTKHENIFQLYPIPAHDFLFIQLANNALNGIVQVTDLTGKVFIQKVLTQNLNEINIADLSAGMYIVSLNYDGREVFSKFVKE